MKQPYFLFVTIWWAGVSALPNQGYENQELLNKTCKLASLIPHSGLSLPDLDLDLDMAEKSIGKIEDPLPINNFSVTINERVLKGTYSFTNGIVEGLSTLLFDFDYNPIHQNLHVNATLKRLRLVADYEIIDGEANLTTLGEHKFSGNGPLTANASGVSASLGFAIRMDPATQYVTIDDLKIDFDFESANIVADNLVVDGVPVQWEEVNQSIRPIYEAVWVEAHSANVQLIQQEINKLLEGCTLMDIIQIITQPK